MRTLKLAPSILACDFARLGDEIAQAEAGGADWIHVDVMDGHFVPNITIGPLIAAAARRSTQLPLDTHLMIEEPERYVAAFADAGVDLLTVHVESTHHLHRVVQQIQELGMRAGVALNPATPVSALEGIAPFVDLVLVMSVNPGFGGQRFIPTSLARIRQVRALLDAAGRDDVDLEVDGGIGPETIREVVQAGANALVAGSAVYNAAGTVAESLAHLRQLAGSAVDA